MCGCRLPFGWHSAWPCWAGCGPDCVRSVACHYTMTPDGHIVIDRHPEMASVIIAETVGYAMVVVGYRRGLK